MPRAHAKTTAGRNSSSRKYAATSAVCAIIVGAGLLASFYYWKSHVYVPQVTFKRSEWLTWDSRISNADEPSSRQKMLDDLITNALPDMPRAEIERVLGRSKTHEEMREHRLEDLVAKKLTADKTAYARTGDGYYFQEHDWDLIYPLGKERIFLWDHSGQLLSPDEEYLIIRVDKSQRFESWYIVGSERWPEIVSEKAARSYRSRR